jgi:hypothetical protein
LVSAAAGKIKIVGIIASLAALALVLSPTFSMLQAPGSNNQISGANSLLEDDIIEEDPTVVEDISDEDLVACRSVDDSVDAILGVTEGRVNDRKIASDTLIAEFCSRPVLIHEIMSTDYKPLTLVAYACDASAGKIGTAAIQDSLSDHNQIYCESGHRLIMNESNTFLATVEEFRTQYLPLFETGLEDPEDVGNETDSFENEDVGSETDEQAESYYFNVTAAEMILDEVTQALEESIALVDAGDYYPAAKSFDYASKKFITLFQEEGDVEPS